MQERKKEREIRSATDFLVLELGSYVTLREKLPYRVKKCRKRNSRSHGFYTFQAPRMKEKWVTSDKVFFLIAAKRVFRLSLRLMPKCHILVIVCTTPT